MKTNRLQRFKPSVVHLEERTLLFTNLMVTTLADDPSHLIRGQTTLRDAITLADANSTNQYIIKFDVKGTMHLTQALPDLTTNISIVGPGVTIKQTTGFGINNIQQPLSVFTVDPGANVSLSGMTITVVPGLNPSETGSGISNDGLLTVTSTTLTDNAWWNSIFNNAEGVLIVNNSTFTCSMKGEPTNPAIDNMEGEPTNAAINNTGMATINHSAFTGNDNAIDNYGGLILRFGGFFQNA